jgi:hypothetical protein
MNLPQAYLDLEVATPSLFIIHWLVLITRKSRKSSPWLGSQSPTITLASEKVEQESLGGNFHPCFHLGTWSGWGCNSQLLGTHSHVAKFWPMELAWTCCMASFKKYLIVRCGYLPLSSLSLLYSAGSDNWSLQLPSWTLRLRTTSRMQSKWFNNAWSPERFWNRVNYLDYLPQIFM